MQDFPQKTPEPQANAVELLAFVCQVLGESVSCNKGHGSSGVWRRSAIKYPAWSSWWTREGCLMTCRFQLAQGLGWTLPSSQREESLSTPFLDLLYQVDSIRLLSPALIHACWQIGGPKGLAFHATEPSPREVQVRCPSWSQEGGQVESVSRPEAGGNEDCRISF